MPCISWPKIFQWKSINAYLPKINQNFLHYSHTYWHIPLGIGLCEGGQHYQMRCDSSDIRRVNGRKWAFGGETFPFTSLTRVGPWEGIEACGSILKHVFCQPFFRDDQRNERGDRVWTPKQLRCTKICRQRRINGEHESLEDGVVCQGELGNPWLGYFRHSHRQTSYLLAALKDGVDAAQGMV